MKAFVVLALFVFAAVAQVLNEKEKAAINKYAAECIASSKVDESLVIKLRAKEITDDNDNLKKYVGCMFKKLHFVSPAGELQTATIRSKIPTDFDQDEATKIIAGCKGVKGDDADSVSFEAYKCYLNKSSKLIQF